ncbi:MAG: CRISPR system precrRNA processing endoribonuclease RAMP protein Cas6 [Candidatus Bathyarchaeia archaeon]
MGISGYELATHRVLMGKKKALGFTGWASYEVRGGGDEWARLTWLMAKFAEYSNVGGNRTGGFGVVKFEPRPERGAAAGPEGIPSEMSNLRDGAPRGHSSGIRRDRD